MKIGRNNIISIDNIKKLCDREIITIVTDGSFKNKILTYVTEIMCNDLDINAAGILPSHKDKLSSHTAEIEKSCIGLEIVVWLQKKSI